MFSPFSILSNFLGSLISLAFLALNAYLIYKWQQVGFTLQSSYAIGSIASTILSLFGWYIVPRLLSKREGEPFEDQTRNIESEDLFREVHANTAAGKTLIFVNGWGTNTRIWNEYKKILKAKYNLVFWDLPGLGKSKQPESQDYSLAKYAQDLKSVITQQPQSQKIILVGHSIGGMIIQQLFKDNLEFANGRINAIALLNTTFENPVLTSLGGHSILFPLQNAVLKPIAYLQIFTWPIWQLSNMFAYLNGSQHLGSFLTGFTGSQSVNQLDYVVKTMVLDRIDVILKGTLEMLKLDTAAVLQSIKVPALVMVAARDFMTQSKGGEFIATNIRNSKLVTVQKAGHLGILEQSQIYISEIMELVERV